MVVGRILSGGSVEVRGVGCFTGSRVGVEKVDIRGYFYDFEVSKIMR